MSRSITYLKYAYFIIIKQVVTSSSKIKTFNNLINSKRISLNTNSLNIKSNQINHSITPFHIYLKDERQKFIKKHSNMSIRDINKCLSERWKKMSNRMKQNYQYRSYLAKKRLYKKQGKFIQLKKPSFIKRISSKTI